MTHTKRLALFLPDFGGGGAERVALALIEGFRARGFEVDLVLASAQGILLPQVPKDIVVINLGATKLRQSVLPLASYLRRRRPFALHAMMWPMPIVALAATALARVETRVIGSEHIMLSLMPFALRHRPVRILTGAAYRRLDGIVAVSQGVANDMAELFGMADDKIAVVHNPLLLPAVPPPSSAMIARWPAGTKRLLAVGELKEQKNYPLLLGALKRLRERVDASLLILGEGALLEDTRALAAALGLGGAVVLAGYESDIWPFFSAAEAFVLSSDYEGFGNVLIEALHAGLAVVSTDCPSGPREILGDGRFGALVPCGDEAALALAMEAALTRPSDGSTGPDRAAALSGDAAIDRHLAVMTG